MTSATSQKRLPEKPPSPAVGPYVAGEADYEAFLAQEVPGEVVQVKE